MRTLPTLLRWMQQWLKASMMLLIFFTLQFHCIYTLALHSKSLTISLRLLGVLTRWILMVQTVDPNDLGATHHFYFEFPFASLVSACHKESTFPLMCNEHSQKQTPIFKLPSNSQCNVMLFIERSLRYTFLMCNSNMSQIRAHDSFTHFFRNLSTKSFHEHLVGPMNMTLSLAQRALSRTYISCGVPPTPP